MPTEKLEKPIEYYRSLTRVPDSQIRDLLAHMMKNDDALLDRIAMLTELVEKQQRTIESLRNRTQSLVRYGAYDD